MEWTDFGDTWLAFCGTEDCRPGVQVEIKRKVEGKRTKKLFLIGDINENGGICDDCMNFSYEDTVVRFKELIKLEQE